MPIDPHQRIRRDLDVLVIGYLLHVLAVFVVVALFCLLPRRCVECLL